jgi:hypothetical protein
MRMPPKSASIDDAKDRIHQAIASQEKYTLDYLDSVATSGLADKRWCAIARTHLEEGFMALQRAIRDYPADDPNQYGKVPLDTPLPKQFQPRLDANTNIAPPHKQVEWGDFSPDGDLGPPK